MSIDFDEWFDSLHINPKYVIKTNLDLFDNASTQLSYTHEKQTKPSKLYQLLRRRSYYKMKKHTIKLVESIKASFLETKSNTD